MLLTRIRFKSMLVVMCWNAGESPLQLTYLQIKNIYTPKMKIPE